MPYEDALRDSLCCLYKESGGFHISIDIIVKLAKSLRLDTFVDTDETPGVKRLSIAGSLLLLELDFANDSTVVNVSLSSGNHAEKSSGGDFAHTVAGNITGEKTSNASAGETPAVSVSLSFKPELRASFLCTSYGGSNSAKAQDNMPPSDDSAASVAERILLSSLAGPTLGEFPKNLKYLADLDRVSPPDADLIVYLDNLATYLATVHHTEKKLREGDWQVSEGFASVFGAVCLNDESANRVGVFLRYWQDSRFVNRELALQKQPPAGKTYTALLAIEESPSAAVDYLTEAASKPWVLGGHPSGTKTRLFLTPDSSSAHLHNQQSVTANAKWRLVLRLADPVFLPQNLLEYLGISDYECAPPSRLDSLWHDAETSRELRFRSGSKVISFCFDDYSPYVRLSAVSVPSLHTLAELMPALRNHIVFTALLESVASAKTTESCTAADVAATKETKRKIRDSLHLSRDVPDEELLGLNTISGDYMGVQMSLERDLDLGDFIKSDSENGDSMVAGDFDVDASETPDSQTQTQTKSQTEAQSKAQSQNTAPHLSITLKEICYGASDSDFDLVLHIAGDVSQTSNVGVDTLVRVQNGQLVSQKTDEDVTMDTESDVSQKFTRWLSLSEDILLALEAMES